ncbi:MAG: class I SAM-dependent RNA methyltransferase [Kiritimatiellae bacterium]|nr:class I SAM-dependent RNA methyltransferase [Kiritimatiellia bacterium]
MTVEIDIQKNVYGGDGLGRLGDGRVVFVPGAFAGEKVRADIVEQKRKYVKARLVEVLEPSPDRIQPGPSVPGMVYSAISYAGELRLKQDQLENFLWKAQSELVPLDVVAAPQPLNYRNKAVYHTQRRDGRWLLGYRAEQSHEVVDLTEDPLACAEINRALPDIRAGVLALLTSGAKAVRDSTKAADNVTVRYTAIDGVKWWLGDPPLGLELTELTGGIHFRVPADGFYQVNPQMADRLVAAVRDAYLEGADSAAHLLDLYCGVGVFGLCCLKGLNGKGANGLDGFTARLVGVESARASVACAKRNAEALGIKASFFCERVGGSLGRIKIGPHHTVLLDPPRGGLEPNVPAWLAKRPAPRIFYVSCDPATLARDLTALMPAYRIEKAALFDLFPRTARFETFVQLARR